MLLEHEGDYGLGMDAMLTICSWNTNEIMVFTPPQPPPIPAGKICSTTRPLTGAVSINILADSSCPRTKVMVMIPVMTTSNH